MNNSEVIKMHDAGVADETIILAINANPPDYTTDVDSLIAFKQAGLAEPVIQAVLVRQNPVVESPPEVEREPRGYFAFDFPSIAPPWVEPMVGGVYYLRCTLYFEDGTAMGTNYARGERIPINTQVQVKALKKKKMQLVRVSDGEKLEVENVPDYTLKTMPELARLILSAEPTPLERLPAELAEDIENGVMRKGMTKEQVLMARGYPPAHRTSSTDERRWTYWNNRFGQHTIDFDANGRLVEGL
jgi:hypothetical protein